VEQAVNISRVVARISARSLAVLDESALFAESKRDRASIAALINAPHAASANQRCEPSGVMATGAVRVIELAGKFVFNSRH